MLFHGTSKNALGVVALLGSFAFGAAAHAKELVMSSWLPPQHPVVEGMMQPWAESVAEVTEGRVTVRILPKPLGPPPAHYDLASDGVADITYGLHSFTKDDRFLRSRLGQFSFLGDTAEAVSVAYWNIYADQLDAQAEHQGTKLLGLFVHGPGYFHSNKGEITSVADFSGLKVRTPGGYIADLAQDLGITTQFMGPGQVYEKLSTGVIDGVTFPIEALKAFNLTEHVTHSMRVPGGIYNTSWFLVINEDQWDGISQEDRTAIEAISGEAFARLAGKRWDQADAAGAAFVATSDVVVYDAPEAVVSEIKSLASSYEETWANAVSDSGFDGAAALAAIRSETGM